MFSHSWELRLNPAFDLYKLAPSLERSKLEAVTDWFVNFGAMAAALVQPRMTCFRADREGQVSPANLEGRPSYECCSRSHDARWLFDFEVGPWFQLGGRDWPWPRRMCHVAWVCRRRRAAWKQSHELQLHVATVWIIFLEIEGKVFLFGGYLEASSF